MGFCQETAQDLLTDLWGQIDELGADLIQHHLGIGGNHVGVGDLGIASGNVSFQPVDGQLQFTDLLCDRLPRGIPSRHEVNQTIQALTESIAFHHQLRFAPLGWFQGFLLSAHLLFQNRQQVAFALYRLHQGFDHRVFPNSGG